MEQSSKMNVGAVSKRIDIVDADGAVLGWFKLNMLSRHTVERIAQCGKFFAEQKFDGDLMEKMDALDNALVEKFSYLLGYDCRESLFSALSPTDVLPSGEMFAAAVMNKISDEYISDGKRRSEARRAAIAKHTAKYTK